MSIKHTEIVPHGHPCSLADCPPGFFFFEGHVHFKSEYHTANKEGKPLVDAYCGESGESFWGGAPNCYDRENLIVQPAVVLPRMPWGHRSKNMSTVRYLYLPRCRLWIDILFRTGFCWIKDCANRVATEWTPCCEEHQEAYYHPSGER